MYLNPEAKRIQTVYTTVITPQNAVGNNEKLYLQDNPIILESKIVGIVGYSGRLNISLNTVIPLPGENVQSNANPLLNLIGYLYLTLVNVNNEIVFNSIPYFGLIPISNPAGKVKRYTAEKIDLSKSYFQFAPVVALSGITRIVPLTFYLK